MGLMELCSEALENGQMPIFRHGITDPDTGKRFLFIHPFVNGIFYRLSIGDRKVFDNLIWGAKYFIALKVYNKHEQKYVHIEKDGKITFTDEPTFFIHGSLINKEDDLAVFIFNKMILNNEYNNVANKRFDYTISEKIDIDDIKRMLETKCK